MGLANLVPGISGGTMLLAAGIYPRFIQAVADVTTLKLRRTSLLVLGLVGLAALLAIALLAGPVKTLVVEHRWVMYSLFIGLTLGGIPVVWPMARPATGETWVGAACGFGCMALLAMVQSSSAGGEASDSILLMFLAGVAGASAMILPGISGGYLLLVLGVYVPILGAIDTLKRAAQARDLSAAWDPAFTVVLPVGLGVLVGVVAVSNLLKLLLARYPQPTLGALLGFLVGAVVGLWPFQHGVAPAIGTVFKGQEVTEELLASIRPEKYPTDYFAPSTGQLFAALGLIAVGFAVTAVIASFGNEETGPGEASS
jgi:putative membrane protein